ncbi:hypothetical protein [Croceicoccus sediminis]|uniref:hypothetical protein n=1 Tax=Croceicoccus sediminis TaxID=2571150 RepID=UPI0014792A88|nr:hypothetical protein [Croceicoccus sediminis]
MNPAPGTIAPGGGSAIRLAEKDLAIMVDELLQPSRVRMNVTPQTRCFMRHGTAVFPNLRAHADSI